MSAGAAGVRVCVSIAMPTLCTSDALGEFRHLNPLTASLQVKCFNEHVRVVILIVPQDAASESRVEALEAVEASRHRCVGGFAAAANQDCGRPALSPQT
ncbi:MULTISPECIES: hypothetical protein [Bradyrhizobium]|uniref:Uncharacterized protein n=1 Tax=Bradyrhizobium septentrionale TaxID=1404411 RepID=A0ABZ2NWX5_9BRAD